MGWNIGICTDNDIEINQHFGRCTVCSIYYIGGGGTSSLLEQRSLQAVVGTGGHTDALRQKAEKLADCQYVLCQKIGNQAVRVLATKGITALEHEGTIEVALVKLASYLRRSKGAKLAGN